MRVLRPLPARCTACAMFDQAQFGTGLDGIQAACCTAATSMMIFSAGINDTKRFMRSAAWLVPTLADAYLKQNP